MSERNCQKCLRKETLRTTEISSAGSAASTAPSVTRSTPVTSSFTFSASHVSTTSFQHSLVPEEEQGRAELMEESAQVTTSVERLAALLNLVKCPTDMLSIYWSMLYVFNVLHAPTYK